MEDAFEEAVAKFGGVSQLARALNEPNVTTVFQWRHRGVPPAKCKAFSALTGISVKRLRPHDWRKYWPEAK